MADAAAIAGSLDGVVGTEDLNVCAEPLECSPVSYALPGQVRVIISYPPGTPEREAVRDVLRSKGFTFVAQDSSESIWSQHYADVWQCFPREYALEEAVAAATVPGVVTVQLLGRGTQAMADGVQYAGVLELPALDEPGRAALHSRLTDLGFIYARPLKGRLQGQGYAWIVPSVPWATSQVKDTPGVLYVVNVNRGEALVEYVGIVPCMPGKLYLFYAEGTDKWDTRRALQDKGFMMLHDDQRVPPDWTNYGMETWVYLKKEFSVVEARDEVRSTSGISAAYGVGRAWPFTGDLNTSLRTVAVCLGKSVAGSCENCDVNGDWRIDILDLIVLRNYMQQQPMLTK